MLGAAATYCHILIMKTNMDAKGLQYCVHSSRRAPVVPLIGMLPSVTQYLKTKLEPLIILMLCDIHVVAVDRYFLSPQVTW